MNKFFSLILFVSSFLSAQIVDKPLNLETTYKSSSVVINGRIVEKSAYWDIRGKMIYTVYKVEVSKSFKGNSGSFQYLLTEGGAIGLEGVIVKPSLKLNVNSSGYMMLKKARKVKLDGFEHNHQLMELSQNIVGYFSFDALTNSVMLPNYQSISKDNFEKSLLNISKKKPKNVNSSLEKTAFSAVDVSNDAQIFEASPTSIVAGNKEVLTIIGSGFGEFISGPNYGYVSFRDADSGGSGWISSLKSQIVSWSDSEIKVEVPSDSGSGTFRITTADNINYESSQTITIPYSINSYRYSISGDKNEEVEYPIHHTGSMLDDILDPNSDPQNNILNGAYQFVLNQDFHENVPARESFEYILTDWVCTTGQNFEIVDEVTEISTATGDDINVITFGETNALGVTYSYFTGCVIDGTDVEIAWREIDIIFNNTINWGYENVTSTQYDFSSTAKHELGHALGFGHNIDSQSLMHYAGGRGPGTVSIQRYLPGSEIILSRDISTALCGNLDPHSVSECSSIDPNLDSDGDGVNDIFDDCDNTPSGETVDNNGCAASELDSDGDGVTDDTDQCPTTPSGIEVDATGCADTDEDGINDYLDLCPDTPLGSEVDSDGCADFQKDTDGDGVTDDVDQCPSTSKDDDVDVFGCTVIILPPDNFEVTVTSNSCLGSNDGSVSISAKDTSYTYVANINGVDYGLNSNDGYSTSIDNLGVGTYSVCFTIDGQNTFNQCYSVVLSQPEALSIVGAQSMSGEILELNLSGAQTFHMIFNGLNKTVSSGQLTLPLDKGINTVKIFTDLECQGVFEESYFNSEDILVQPNPTRGIINVFVGGSDQEAQFVIRDIRGATLLETTKSLSQNREVEIDLAAYPNGVYFVQVIAPTVLKTSKIIKYE